MAIVCPTSTKLRLFRLNAIGGATHGAAHGVADAAHEVGGAADGGAAQSRAICRPSLGRLVSRALRACAGGPSAEGEAAEQARARTGACMRV